MNVIGIEKLERRMLLTTVLPPVEPLVPINVIPVDPPIVISDPGTFDAGNGGDLSTDPTPINSGDPSADLTNGVPVVTADPAPIYVTVDPGVDGIAYAMGGGVQTTAAGAAIQYSKQTSPTKATKTSHHSRTHAAKKVHHLTSGTLKHAFNTTRLISARTRGDLVKLK